MLIPVFLRKVTKYGANGEKRMHQLSFPCRHHLSRTYVYATAHQRTHTHAPTPALPRIRATTLAHLRHHSHTTAPPHSRTFVLHLYTLAPPIAHLRPPSIHIGAPIAHLCPPSIHIGAPHCAPSSSLPSFGAYQNQSEFIRAYPISSEKFRWVLIDSD